MLLREVIQRVIKAAALMMVLVVVVTVALTANLTITKGLLASVAEAQTSQAGVRLIRPRHHGPMHRPGVDDGHRQAQATISRNHITAPLGQSPNSVQNQPGIVNSIIEEFARVGAAQAQAKTRAQAHEQE